MICDTRNRFRILEIEVGREEIMNHLTACPCLKFFFNKNVVKLKKCQCVLSERDVKLVRKTLEMDLTFHFRLENFYQFKK